MYVVPNDVTGDAGYIDDDNYVFVMSRTDDVINVAGHRISTGGIEEVTLTLTSTPTLALTLFYIRFVSALPNPNPNPFTSSIQGAFRP